MCPLELSREVIWELFILEVEKTMVDVAVADSMLPSTGRPKRHAKRLNTEDVLQMLDDSDISLSDGDMSEAESFDDSDGDPTFELSANDSDSESEPEPDNPPLIAPDENSAPGDSTESSDEDMDIGNPPDQARERGRARARGRGRPFGRRVRGIGGRGRPMQWQRSEHFAGNANQQQQDDANDPDFDKTPSGVFTEYFNDEIIETIARNTNVTYLQKHGRALDTNPVEVRRFFGINIIMGSLRFPRARMYWARATAVPAIVQAMSRDRYFKIRANIKIVNDLDVSDEARQNDKLWKVRPLLDQVRNICLQLPRPLTACVDEQMIPFTGHTRMRQHIRGKPNPTGLKNFVIASQRGLVLDFEIYQGKEQLLDPNNPNMPVGGLVVLRLISSLPAGSSVYMDRYFTNMPLFDNLMELHINGTGTIMKRSVPAGARQQLLPDGVLGRQGRGSTNQLVREDGKIAVVQWYDNKSVLLASTEHGVDPAGDCRRWSKPDRAYIHVRRPAIMKSYNDKMGGVDLNDRMISLYRISARTSKWTVRTIFHMIDMSLVNSWIFYRGKTSSKMQFLDFRMTVGEFLAYSEDAAAPAAPMPDEPLRKRVPIPPQAARKASAKHLPRFIELKNAARCRHPGCKTGKSPVMCTECNVFLCMRECFENFHL